MDLWTLKWPCIKARNDSIMEIVALGSETQIQVKTLRRYVHMKSLEMFAGLI